MAGLSLCLGCLQVCFSGDEGWRAWSVWGDFPDGRTGGTCGFAAGLVSVAWQWGGPAYSRRAWIRVTR